MEWCIPIGCILQDFLTDDFSLGICFCHEELGKDLPLLLFFWMGSQSLAIINWIIIFFYESSATIIIY